MSLAGANPQAKVSGLDELPGKSNYFVGNDPRKWRTNVPTYPKVRYEGVYPGVDLVYYGNQGRLEYDFVIAPGANPSPITLDVGAGLVPARGRPQGAPLRVAENGDLVVQAEGGEVRFHKPVVYQPLADSGFRGLGLGVSNPKSIDGKYVLKGSNQVTFEVASYDRKKPLVIDPVLIYSTYLGGSDFDFGNGIAVDAAGNAYVTGSTCSTDFPTTSGAFQTSLVGFANAFVTKLNAPGSALVYSTYLGGSGGFSGYCTSQIGDAGFGVAVDGSGNAYITGSTRSSDFPVTSGAFQTSLAGYNVFVTKLSPTGSALIYSTYLGGVGVDSGSGIALGSSGNAYVTGSTNSQDFPTTSGAVQTSLGTPTGNNSFVAKLSADGSALIYSTYLGGNTFDSASGIAVDAAGNAYVAGYTQSNNFPTTPGAFQTSLTTKLYPPSLFFETAFVSKLNAAGSGLVYSTYLGGSGGDLGGAIAVDASGNAYVTGSTASTDFPVTPGAFQTSPANCCVFPFPGDAFVTKLNPTGSALVYSTYLGGGSYDLGSRIALDVSNNAYVTGITFSTDFPTMNPFQPVCSDSCSGDTFVTKLNAAGSALVYSTFLGTNSSVMMGPFGGIAVDPFGNAYLAGLTGSLDFPTVSSFQPNFGGGFSDAFVAKISPLNAPGVGLNAQTVSFSAAVGTSVSQSLTLRSVGSQNLVLRRILALEPRVVFAQTNTCAGTMSPGDSCTIMVTFTPKRVGVQRGFLLIVDNAYPRPATLFRMTGTGL